MCVCVCLASVILHAKYMVLIILPSVACLALPYFSHYIIDSKIFGKKVIEHKIGGFILIFFTNFVCDVSYSKKNSARYFHKCT